MKKGAYIFTLLTFLCGCQPDIPAGNEIVFGDVIGNYVGECADFSSSPTDLMNREDATLSVIVASTNEAGIKTSCARIMDQDLPLKSASAANIVFEKDMGNSLITMTYIAAADSIVILHTQDGSTDNLIFAGKRN